MLLLSLVLVCWAAAAPYNGSYYKGIDTSLRGQQFRAELGALIYNHKVVSYNGVWSAFDYLDQNIDGCTNDTVRGIYSSKCWNINEQCGSYKHEGDCFNREHVWPKSWWGGFSAGKNAQTDLFLLFPADGYVNGLRGNYPLGVVNNPTYTSKANAKVGACATPGSSGNCFEPPDMFKGAVARAYFYISTAYINEWSCCDVAGVNRSDIKPWMANQLVQWHNQFPVNVAEQNINDEIFTKYQNNRNPFVDFPAWVSRIW